MGIDGIGKPPGASIGSVGNVQGGEAPRGAEPFAVDRSAPASPSERISTALSSLQRGELSLDQYLDGRVNEATNHLVGKLSPDQLDFVKQSLREQLATDPVLIELVQRTTGASPATDLR
ncbi:MAG TPA: hypothetical protein VGM44_02120 [Polyangiaceae bacterium]|jgi:hypothetical protein